MNKKSLPFHLRLLGCAGIAITLALSFPAIATPAFAQTSPSASASAVPSPTASPPTPTATASNGGITQTQNNLGSVSLSSMPLAAKLASVLMTIGGEIIVVILTFRAVWFGSRVVGSDVEDDVKWQTRILRGITGIIAGISIYALVPSAMLWFLNLIGAYATPVSQMTIPNLGG